MTRIAALAAVLALAACNAPLTPAQQAEAQLAVSVVGAAVPASAQVFAAGQLVCAGASGLAAVIDAATGKPYLVTGKPAQIVANVCSVLNATPVPLAAGITSVPGVLVTPPPG
jgi:hypothetical protein